MTEAHKLDCESVSDSCRFVIQSEDEQEAVELAKNHMKRIHDQELTDDELRNEHLQTV
jgi:predicted small metal-binding protein